MREVTPYPSCDVCDWWDGEKPNTSNAHYLDWVEHTVGCCFCKIRLEVCKCEDPRDPLTREERIMCKECADSGYRPTDGVIPNEIIKEMKFADYLHDHR